MIKITQLPLILIYFLSASCISVSLPDAKIIRANDVIVKEPGHPFTVAKHESLDAIWSNSTNGNSISYLSDCQTKNDPPLQSITIGIVNDLDKKKAVLSETIKYNQREALHSMYKGTVDGIPTIVELMVLKKNSCIYVLTFVALEDSYEKDKRNFTDFYNGFKAP